MLDPVPLRQKVAVPTAPAAIPSVPVPAPVLQYNTGLKLGISELFLSEGKPLIARDQREQQ